MMRIPWKSVDWSNSLFLLGTLLVTITAVPFYIWQFGLSWFQVVLFMGFYAATGLSITLGYHRLYSHRAFKAAWPARLFTLLFGAAAFENSVLRWAADHRRHHKFVDQEADPYDISKGFFHAHIGWILFKLQPDTSLDLVRDLQQDRWVRWQHRHYKFVALLVGFALPALIGWVWGGPLCALGSLLIAGFARMVLVQHFTFFINSLCHTIGRRPYSATCTARDSALMAWFTFGEGYHNFHHAFQHDYRNGVRAWQFDPTKWAIWLLHRLGLASHLRRVPAERIQLAEVREQQRRLAAELNTSARPLAAVIQSRLQSAQARLQEAFRYWEQQEQEYRRVVEKQFAASKQKMAELQRELRQARDRLQSAIRDWRETHQLVLTEFAAQSAA